jgi:hypothetical protein
LFWRSEYRYSSFNSANVTISPAPGSGLQVGVEHEALCPDDHYLAGL